LAPRQDNATLRVVAASAQSSAHACEQTLNWDFGRISNDLVSKRLFGRSFKVQQMIGGVSLPQEDGLEQMVAASLAGAIEGMLLRSEGNRLTLIRTLRSQMARVLAEAPIKGDPVTAVALRSRMAALFEAEFARMEVVEEQRGQD
jgi:hypothetical protein